MGRASTKTKTPMGCRTEGSEPCTPMISDVTSYPVHLGRVAIFLSFCNEILDTGALSPAVSSCPRDRPSDLGRKLEEQDLSICNFIFVAMSRICLVVMDINPFGLGT